MTNAKDLRKGQKIKFQKESYYWDVRLVRHPYVICTQKLFGEHYYTILNIEKNIRGAGSHDGYSYQTDTQVAEAMRALHGEDPEGLALDISSPNRVGIDITDVVDPKVRV
ncbi:hypothetical protein [Acinetobacter colistiniresistens]|uniref:hypothetical protein n=1 Tax=Acinetobacter colistiniresistens TaxID=280145 RepID=UPI00124FAE02|nr:hypothetical protein [Acinetobacter colistiniresistens]